MDLTFKIKKKSGIVFDYLTDMQKFVLVHPVIFKIEKTGNNDFLIYEKLKLGFIPFSFTYPASVVKNSIDRHVTMNAVVMKLAKIEMNFVLKSQGEFTIIEENIKFESALPLKSVMQGIFRKQHTQLFKNIELMPEQFYDFNAAPVDESMNDGLGKPKEQGG